MPNAKDLCTKFRENAVPCMECPLPETKLSCYDPKQRCVRCKEPFTPAFAGNTACKDCLMETGDYN